MTRVRTDNMAEATYLSMSGFSFAMEREGGSCVWVFDSEDGLAKRADTFRAGAARVEPRRFAREWAAIRSDMITFLDATTV